MRINKFLHASITQKSKALGPSPFPLACQSHYYKKASPSCH